MNLNLFIWSAIVVLSFSVPVVSAKAQEQDKTPYQEVLDRLNEEYDYDVRFATQEDDFIPEEYRDVVIDVTPEEYEKIVREEIIEDKKACEEAEKAWEKSKSRVVNKRGSGICLPHISIDSKPAFGAQSYNYQFADARRTCDVWLSGCLYDDKGSIINKNASRYAEFWAGSGM